MHGSETFRQEFFTLLRGPNAHATFEKAVAGFPFPLQGAKPEGAAHTPWEILEHIRIAQRDILDFCRNPGHESPEFPDGYWPRNPAPAGESDWERSVEGFLADRVALEALIGDPARDPLGPVPDAEGPTLVHQVVIAAAHNSYHLGQLLLLRRMLGG